MYLLSAADHLRRDFFKPSKEPEEGEQEFECQYAGFKLRVRKRTKSDAKPVNVVYEIHLGALLGSRNSKALLAYVLYPKDDTEANREAFKCCLRDLVTRPETFMSEIYA